MKELINFIFGYMVFFYTLALISSYLMMAILAFLSYRRHKVSERDPASRDNIRRSPYTPGVSIVAGAYNEEAVVVESVESFLRQDYPLFEVVIVNDGSKDKTLELLIDHFKLEEVPFVYIERLRTKPFHRLFRSTDPRYSKLTVVDKENGGTKADPINTGLNVAQYPYFINTDIDCVLSRDAIYQCIMPVLEQDNVIAVSGAMAMNNGCEIESGEIKKRRVSKAPAPLFQSMEYLRSFMVGKMAWSRINAMPNVSGGYGLFETRTVIAAGGYSPDSFAEDMDMVVRMVAYCCDFNRPYRIVQIPETCCWTQGPPNLKVLYRQRVRWGRGLIQFFFIYFRMMFKPKYRQMGMITMPYIFIFEFLAPVIEFCGMLTFIYLAVTGAVNWPTAVVIFGSVTLFNYAIGIITCYYDYIQGNTYGSKTSYLWLMGAAFLEPIFYHPLLVVFSLRGYFNFLTNKRAVWGAMTRKSFSSNTSQQKTEDTPADDDVSNPDDHDLNNAGEQIIENKQ